jgi:uracil-DNA glycosylase family 4
MPPALPLSPPPDCPLCPRLGEFRCANRENYPGYFNNPVPSFGSRDAQLLIVGLAPGLHGANRTGRPFTGDFAGDLLYATLRAQGLASGGYSRDGTDDLALHGVRITNAVRCVPPQNKPEPVEIATCRSFLKAEIEAMPRLCAILCLGQISHFSTTAALGVRRKEHPFSHGAKGKAGKILLFSSYHCSRYNTNTGVLTAGMFASVMEEAKRAAGLP